MRFQEIPSSHRHRAFTLIEVIVVISTLAFTLPIITIILFIIIRQQLAISRMAESKRQGDQAVSVIQNQLNSKVVTMYDSDGKIICDSVSDTPQNIDHFLDTSGNQVSFSLADNTLYLVTSDTQAITNPQKVIVEDNLIMQCTRSKSYTHPIVEISFSVIPAGNFRTEELASMRLYYSTKVIIRTQ